MNDLSVFWRGRALIFENLKATSSFHFSVKGNSPLFLHVTSLNQWFLKKLRHLVIQSGIKTKLIMTPSYMFSRVSCWLDALVSHHAVIVSLDCLRPL